MSFCRSQHVERQTSLSPESMQVAVFFHTDHLVCSVEHSDRFALRRQFFTHDSILRVQLYPLDIMLFCHRMQRRAYCHLPSAFNAFDHRHMFLLRSINRVCLKTNHRFPAAYESPCPWIHHFHHVAANGATIDFSFLCHDTFSFLLVTQYCVLQK